MAGGPKRPPVAALVAELLREYPPAVIELAVVREPQQQAAKDYRRENGDPGGWYERHVCASCGEANVLRCRQRVQGKPGSGCSAGRQPTVWVRTWRERQAAAAAARRLLRWEQEARVRARRGG